jgi:hypothetical protein
VEQLCCSSRHEEEDGQEDEPVADLRGCLGDVVFREARRELMNRAPKIIPGQGPEPAERRTVSRRIESVTVKLSGLTEPSRIASRAPATPAYAEAIPKASVLHEGDVDAGRDGGDRSVPNRLEGASGLAVDEQPGDEVQAGTDPPGQVVGVLERPEEEASRSAREALVVRRLDDRDERDRPAERGERQVDAVQP